MESGAGFEYLDHPADIQIHSWGVFFGDALARAVEALFAYMTPREAVSEVYPFEWNAHADDTEGLVCAILQEALFFFQAEPFFVAKRVEVVEMKREPPSCVLRGWGESFSTETHEQLADVKAITYSNMQIIETESRTDLYVIIDI